MLYNSTPRKCLDYKTPVDVMFNEINKSGAALEMRIQQISLA